MLKMENIELIQDGEYGLFEGTSDEEPWKEDIISFFRTQGFDIREGTLSIFFDKMQGFWRFSGSHLCPIKANRKNGINQ